MLDKIAYDYVTEIKTRGANVAKIKYELAEKVKKFSEEDKKQLRENINDRRQSRKCEIGISLLERLQTNCADWKKIDHVENDFFIDGEDI